MKLIYRIISLAAACAICAPLLFSCSQQNPGISDTVELWGESTKLDELDRISTKTAPAPIIPVYSGADTFKIGISTAPEKLSPFFANDENGLYASSLTQIQLLPAERGGRVVTSGIDGERFEYKGKEYEYYSIADVDISIGADNRATYSFKMRDDVFFSDGTNLTADDAIFSMYVLLDPSYHGYSKLSSLPISGVDVYREGMTTLYSKLYSAGRESSTDTVSDAFWEKLDDAGKKYSTDIIAYIIENYGNETYYQTEYGGKWGNVISGHGGLSVAYAMTVWGLAEWDKAQDGTYTGALTDITGANYDCTGTYPDVGSFFNCLVSEYETLEMLSDSQSVEVELFDYIKDSFGEDYSYYFEVKLQSGESSASNISGIKKTGMYSFDVTLDKYDATAIYAFSFYIAPLHVYGSRSEYKYSENRFGFTKGDLRNIEKAGLASTGAGAYTYKKEQDGTYSFERNTYYCFGCPYVKKLELLCGAVSDDPLLDIKEGKYDITLSELTTDLVSSVKGEEYKDSIAYCDTNSEGYGYIGLNAQKVNVDGKPDSEASFALRRAFCILFDVYKYDSIYYYYGERASTVDYPLDPNSWAYPDEASSAFKKKLDGSDIYLPDMTEDQRYKAALEAAREYLLSAGYEADEKNKKLVTAPVGAALEYEFLICDGESTDHPCFKAVKNTSDALSSLGITLKITSVKDAQELERRLCRGDAQMWAYAWEFSQDPDMYQVYYSKNTPAQAMGTGSNYFYISDKALDTAISDARKSNDTKKRAEIYKECFDIVGTWGVEVPMYVKHSMFLYAGARISQSYKPDNYSVYFSWADEAHKIQLS